jgi:DNA invertase Pin-like site-specific DNA recombinase
MNTPHSAAAVLYRRVSTSHQDNSLEVQEHLNDEYCRRVPLDPIAHPFEDEDVSGSVPFAERAGGQALLTRLSYGGIGHLVTAKQDRLGRDTLDTIATIRRVWDLGIIPHFTAEGGAFPRTPQNELLFEIKASVAQYERNLIRDRTRLVMNHKFNRYELTGNVPYGYDCLYQWEDGLSYLSPKALNAGELARVRADLVSSSSSFSSSRTPHLVDNPAEQAVLRQMAAWRSAGCKYEDIAAQLNALGHRTKLGRAWQIGSVSSVLSSRHTRRLLSSSELQTPAPAAIAA